MNLPKNLWKVAVGAVALLAVFLLALSIKTFREIGYVGANQNTTNTVSVDGSGDAYAVPDIATFTFSVTDTEKTVADAQTKATAKVNAALKVVRDGGVADKDIQTQYYSINPHYEYQNSACSVGVYNATVGAAGSSSSVSPIYCPPGKSVLTGYDVSQSVTVKLRDLSKAGTLLTALGSAGVDNLNGPSFDVDNPDAVQADARSKAIADAQKKAQELAKELGVRLVRIVSFTENNGSYPRPVMYGLGASDSVATKAAAVPEISAGQQKVTDTVSITYEIK